MSISRGNLQRTGVYETRSLEKLTGQAWKFEAGDAIRGEPVVDGGMIYFGSDDHNFYAVETATGQLRWKFKTRGRIVASSAVYEGNVVFGCDDSRVYCLSAETGEQRWAFNTGNWIDDAPLVFDGIVFIASSDRNGYALSLDEGKVMWKFNTQSKWVNPPALYNGVIYITSGSNIFAKNLYTGELIWKDKIEGISRISTCAAIDGGLMYFGGLDGKLRAYDLRKQSIRWEFDTQGFILSSPAVCNGIVYFGSRDFHFYALDSHSGELIWRVETSDKVECSPVIAGQCVYFDTGGFSEPQMNALDLHNGTPLWTHEDESDIYTFIVDNGFVYYGTEMGDLVALH
jgi:eukaryotic-like serine/threonine-protein kinase